MKDYINLNQRTTLSPHDVIYVEADINYTKFNLICGKSIVTTVTLKDVEKLLINFDFLRIHKSYLINKNFIKNIRKEKRTASITMIDSNELLVSRRKNHLIKLIK